ncbi:hypothetical protein KKH23_01485 [Patescibacteria group bacterium]|nr:hypothetical protein [Patescibacteria group bacterium]MBU0922885.1 hypothetical protein [Patescibacteria group bacterium]MBU1066382.1 hypothetical protein [Patescibacteria group bacterium]
MPVSNDFVLSTLIILAYILLVIVAAWDNLKKDRLSKLETWDSDPE